MRKSWHHRLPAGSVGKTAFVLLILMSAPAVVPAGVPNKKEDAHEVALASVTMPTEGAIVISGTTLTKGAPRDTVMRDLSRQYLLHKLKSAEGEEDSWLITEKEHHDDYLGVVSFANGKLRRVARFRKWTQDEDSVELAQRLCDLVEQLTGKGGAHLEVTAKTNDSGKFTVRGIEMISGDKRISLNLISHADEADPSSRQVEVHLDEVVQ